jgi:inhibitor of KinA
VLVRFADEVGDEAFVRGRALLTELERDPPAGLTELVPAFTTLLLEFRGLTPAEMTPVMRDLEVRLRHVTSSRLPPARLHEIPVCYDGPDLERVAQQHGLTPAEVRDLHAAPVYKVHFLGFAPGFPYLGDLDPRLHTPRLASPRPRVPAGSVAIGGEHTGIYSIASPGGWNLIGRTSVVLFDPQQEGEAMFLLRPGDQLRFRPVPAG